MSAQQDGFERVFLGQHCWFAIRIGGGVLSKIKYIAAYQSNPISAITTYAKVEFYNLDAIIAVGYRVNSYQATH